MKKVSIVIPAYNEEQYLGACLESLCAQETRFPFEVIVVDNASTDKTAAIAESFQDRLPVKVLLEPKKGRGAARHAGSSAAQGDIILSTDADTILPPYWIEIMADAFSDPSVVAVTGTGYINDCSWFTNKQFNIIQLGFTVLYRVVTGHYCVVGFNGGFRKEAYTKSGGYNAALNAQEDTEIGFALRKFGRIAWVRDSRALVSGRRFQRGIAHGLLDYVKSFTSFVIHRRKNAYLRDTR